MSEGRITIHPDNLPPSGRRNGRWRSRLPIAAAVVGAFAFGWLLGSPKAMEDTLSGSAAGASPTTTARAAGTTSTTVASVTTGPNRRGPRIWDTSLSDVVPDFPDTIVMLTSPADAHDVMVWNPSERVPDSAISIEPGVGAMTSGLDVSGEWFVQALADGTLSITPVSTEGSRSSPREIGGAGVMSMVWHDTEPGRLAWMGCPEPSNGSSHLFTLDVADPAAEPVLVRSYEHGCGWDISMDRWYGAGVLMTMRNEKDPDPVVVLVDPDGTQRQIEFASSLVAESPDGTAIWRDSQYQGGTPFVLLPGVSRKDAVPGLAGSESLFAAAWSPNGSRLAMSLGLGPGRPESALRIVDVATGATIVETVEPGSNVVGMAWNNDGRFLLFEMWNYGSKTGDLVFYDTTTKRTTTVPLTEIVNEIRVR